MSPVIIPENLPAGDVLRNENIFVMNETRALHQDIRPLAILVVNLMPLKAVTETQLLRLLGNTLIQVEVTFLHMESHRSKNTAQSHLDAFYQTFPGVRGRRFDAMVVTGAPVETLEFPEVGYWPELTRILDWARDDVFCSLFLCWGAQAALFHHHGIPKAALPEKLSGVFAHHLRAPLEPLFRGFDDVFFVPHSRHTGIRDREIARAPDIEILAESPEAGPCLLADRARKNLYITGHPEYDRDTLQREYLRDRDRGLDPRVPRHYFPGDDPGQDPLNTWRGHAHLLFANWINYYVYQRTGYDFAR